MTGTNPHRRPLARRTFLLGGLLAGSGITAACTATAPQSPPTSAAPPPPPTSIPTVAPTPGLTPPLADVPGYAVLPGEVEPACKQTAVDFVTAVLTTGTVATAGTPLEARLAMIGQPLKPATPLLDLLPPDGASALEVVYPQYGGLSGSRETASVMLLADQLVSGVTTGGEVERRSTTVDVRLVASRGVWTVVDVLPAALPRPAPVLSSAAQVVLESDRIVLPAAARADLLGGRVHDAVALALAQLAERWRVDVHVLVGGHPENVFDTDRVSRHTIGRAADVWALDDVPVIDQARCPWREAMQEASAAGATEVGGPAGTGGPGFFTDQVHQDHLHLGFGRVGAVTPGG